MIRALPAVAVGALLVPALANAEVVLLAQQRQIQAITTADGGTTTAVAPGFAPFVASVTANAPFPAAGGGTGTNTAVSTINCLLDPNLIRASGSLAAAGGFTLVAGTPSLIVGEAGANIEVDFDVLTPTPFHLFATPRPSALPQDEYKLSLRSRDPRDTIYSEADTLATEGVNLNGILPPATYTVTYIVRLTGAADRADAEYGFSLSLGSPACGPSDVASAGGVAGSDGVLDNNDFIVFIDRFFGQDASADVGAAGGVVGNDGAFDSNDFVVFIDRFFAGCV